MKSFTRNQPNVEALRADKRFDALVKHEMTEHKHVISSHHKEMQELRDTLRLSMERFDALSGRIEHELKDFKTYVVCHLGILKEKLMAHESLLDEQKKTNVRLYEQLHEFHVTHCSKEWLEKFTSRMESHSAEEAKNHLVALQDLQRELKLLISSLKEDLINSKDDTKRKFGELDEKIDSNFNVSKIDREGVLKGIRVYEKTIFIIEKKLENIYTLIERINKRGTP